MDQTTPQQPLSINFRKMALPRGFARRTSAFARWRSDLTELRGQLALGHLASVIGLAPIRPDLKGRLRELTSFNSKR